MKVQKIQPQDVEKVLDKAGSQFFTVEFVKRTDNTLRTMNCRRGVKKGIKGTGSKKQKSGLYTVYDMVEKGWRTINVSGVRVIRMKGIEYRVG